MLDPARRRGAEKAEACLGASSLLGPPEDLSTVEKLQARLRRLPLHPTTKVSVWPCAVAVCAVYRGSLQTRRPQPHSSHSRCHLRFFDFPTLTKSVSKLTGLSQGNIREKSTFLFPFRLRRLQNRHRLCSLLDCPWRCPPLRRCRRLRRRVFWLPAPLLLLLLWTSCL